MNIEEINIHSLPSKLISERNLLPRIGAIYFVLEKKKLLYIGKAQNLKHRWYNHKILNENLFSPEIAWLEITDEYTRFWTERKLIKKYVPPLNIFDTPRYYDCLRRKNRK